MGRHALELGGAAHGEAVSERNGAAGGPRIVSSPGPDGITSPTRTSGWPPTSTPAEPPGPIGNGYGAPETEFTIWHTDPTVASGSSPASRCDCITVMMTPESGGPAMPGESVTAHPIET